MKNGQIFARKSTARGGLDLEYLDETSRRKISLRERENMDQQIGKKLKHFTDYASKETLGQVHVGGFFHNHICINADGTKTAPSKLSNAERKLRITECWRKHLARFPTTAKRPVIAHRLVFSMSKEQHDALASAGINPDQVLHSTMKTRHAEVQRDLSSRRFRRLRLRHSSRHGASALHVAICPRTANGNYVGCSTSRSNNSKHKRQMDGIIKSWFEQENPLGKKSGFPQKLEETLSKRLDADKLVFLTEAESAPSERASNHPDDAMRLQQLYQAIRNLEAGIAKKRQALAIESGSRLVSRLMRVPKPKVVRVVEKIAMTIERRSIRDMQKTLFQLKRQYRAEHKRYSRLFGFTAYSNRNAHMQHVAQAKAIRH